MPKRKFNGKGNFAKSKRSKVEESNETQAEEQTTETQVVEIRDPQDEEEDMKMYYTEEGDEECLIF